MRVLFAEDDRSTRRELATALDKWGYDVAVACDGAEAWAALQCDDAPELVILDLMMPTMDGIEVCRNVRQAFEPGSIYIILLTAKDRRKDVVEGFEAGADDYIIKPFDDGTVRERLGVGSHIIESHANFTNHNVVTPTAVATGALAGRGTEEALDVAELLASFSGDMQLLKMIAEVFLDGFPRLLYDIRDAYVRGDSEALYRQAHSLKRCVDYFSAEFAVRSALQLEMMGRAGDLAGADEIYRALEAEMVRLKPALWSIVKEYV